MGSSPYLGPRVDPRRSRDKILRRIEAFVARRSGEIHRENVLRWSGEDETTFPTMVVARAQAQYEAEILFRALGPWAGVSDEAIPFPNPSRDQWFSRLDDL